MLPLRRRRLCKSLLSRRHVWRGWCSGPLPCQAVSVNSILRRVFGAQSCSIAPRSMMSQMWHPCGGPLRAHPKVSAMFRCLAAESCTSKSCSIAHRNMMEIPAECAPASMPLVFGSDILHQQIKFKWFSEASSPNRVRNGDHYSIMCATSTNTLLPCQEGYSKILLWLWPSRKSIIGEWVRIDPETSERRRSRRRIVLCELLCERY